MEPLNTKILYELLDDALQPQKTIFTPNADMMKLATVLSVGHKVEFVKPDDIISVYIHDMNRIDNKLGFCSERSVIFKNGIPQEGKIHVKNPTREKMSSLTKAEVIESNSEDVKSGDIIYYKEGQCLELPDSTEIISETQVYYK